MTKKDLDQRSDGELIELYVRNRTDSEMSMQVLMNRHSEDIYGRIVSKVGNESDAKDLQQELWTKVARNLHQYKDEGKFKHYLSKLVSNLLIDFYRKSGRDKEVFVDDQRFGANQASADGDSYSYTDNYEDPVRNTEQQVSDDELIQYLTGVLIPELPVEQRAAWLLRHESEYWEPGRPFEWHHLAELNNLTVAETAEIFETARHKLMTTKNTERKSELEELELLVFLVWTQAQRFDKSQKFTWDYFAELLGQPVNTMKTRYRTAQRSLDKSLSEYMQN